MPIDALAIILIFLGIIIFGAAAKMQDEHGMPFSTTKNKGSWPSKNLILYWFNFKSIDLRILIITSWVFLVFFGWTLYACYEEIKVKNKEIFEIFTTEPSKLGIKEQYIILQEEKQPLKYPYIFPEGSKIERTYYEQSYLGVTFEVTPTDKYILPNGEIYELGELREETDK